jgi:hypothetical protein
MSAKALAELIEESQKNEKTLHPIARQSLAENAPDMRLVVVVDQFEEVSRSLITMSSSDRWRRRTFAGKANPVGRV